MKRGIYIIRNKVNGKVYVGSSFDIYARFKRHVTALRKNIHANTHLQRAWLEYGEDAFELLVAESVQPETELTSVEQVWIDKTDATNRHIGYNISPCATGRRMPEEVKAKIRAKHIGKKLSAEHIEKMASAKRGKPSWNKGLKMTESHRAASSEAKIKFFEMGGIPWNKGIPMSDEQKSKVSASRTGKDLGNTHGFKRGHGFWTGKNRPNVSGENNWRARARALIGKEILT